MNLYPRQFQLPEVTAHVLGLLERRRLGHDAWTKDVEEALTSEARAALDEAERSFSEVADDAAFWERVEETVLTVALPRYFLLAREQHTFERAGSGAWRGGDLLSRAAYALAGLGSAVVIARTPLPDWLEPLPVALFLLGPFIPDAQAWLARRKYARALELLVRDMAREEREARPYRPLGVDEAIGADADAQARVETRSAESRRQP